MTPDNEPPYLGCPNCDRALFPAKLRGYTNDDGEYIEHSETCRCHLCGWVWQEDEDALTAAIEVLRGVVG